MDFYRDSEEQLLTMEIDKNDKIMAATAFHVGDGILVTAKHNVDHDGTFKLIDKNGKEFQHSQKFLAPGKTDIAVLKTNFQSPGATVSMYTLPTKTEPASLIHERRPSKFIKLNSKLNRAQLMKAYLLEDVYLFGFPPVPMTVSNHLISVKAQVNSIVLSSQSDWPLLVISSVPRGGFSGGPVMDQDGSLIGICIEALYEQSEPSFSGFTAAICIEPLLNLMKENDLRPEGNSEFLN